MRAGRSSVAFGIAGEGDAGRIGRATWSEGYGAKRSEGMLIGTVVIHRPDFFCARTGADESDLSGGDAGQSAGEPHDDFVGELMGELANLRVGGSATINFCNHGLRRGIGDIVKPGLDRYFAGRFNEIAESDVMRVDGRIGPRNVAKFRRNRWL